MSVVIRASIDDIALVIGEKMSKGLEDVIIDGDPAKLSWSNFRLFFQLQSGSLLCIPIHSIMYVIYKGKNRGSSSIHLQLRGLHSLVLSAKKPDLLQKTLLKLVKTTKTLPRCTLSTTDTPDHMKHIMMSNEIMTWPLQYFESLVDTILDVRWRITDVNRNFHISSYYPRLLCVPEQITDRMILNCASYVKNGRIPVLCWTSSESRVSIYRGGIMQPNQCEYTMEYWKAIHQTAVPFSVIPILVEEACTESSSIASIALYMASEDEMSKLLDAIATKKVPVPFSPEAFPEIGRWERRLRSAINSAKAVSNMIIKEQKSVVLQSDNRGGPLFTISALSQLLVDSKCRTLRGFCSLIEKEFIYFGFPFNSSDSNSKKNQSSSNSTILNEYAGGFILFIDCVWTLLSQLGYAFEFNKELLLFLVDIAGSGLYDTFNASCEKDRKSEFYKCIWSFVLRQAHAFVNDKYKPEDSYVLLQLCESGFTTAWNSWILQRKIAFCNLNNVNNKNTYIYNIIIY